MENKQEKLFDDKRVLIEPKYAKAIYIHQARRSGKTMACMRMIAELMDAGYNVVPVYRTPNQELQGRRFESLFVDKDILTPEAMDRAEIFLNEVLKMKGETK